MCSQKSITDYNIITTLPTYRNYKARTGKTEAGYEGFDWRVLK